MHDDKFAYFVYIIIDNLDVAIKLNHKRSKMMQLKILFIVKTNIIIKYEIYHKTMKNILKRKLNDDFEHFVKLTMIRI